MTARFVLLSGEQVGSDPVLARYQRAMKAIALVAAGGAMGAVCRYLLTLWASRWTGLPVGTLIVNVVGSFLLGWLLASTQDLPPEAKLFVGTGLCGALTTFSTFSVESLTLLETHDWRAFFLNLALHLGLGLAAAWLGASLRT